MRPTAALAITLLATVTAAALPAHVRLAIPFDNGFHACEGAANPFVAAGNVKLGPGAPGRGQALRFRALKPGAASALVVDGVNLPALAGTVSARFRWPDGVRGVPDRLVWLITLVPSAGDPYAGASEVRGTALSVVLEPAGTLALAVFELGGDGPGLLFSKGYDLVPPDRIVARIPLADGQARNWHRIRFGWDRASGRAWFGVDDVLRAGKVAFAEAAPHCLLVGSPPRLNTRNAAGFAGELDDLLVLDRHPGADPAAGTIFPAELPPQAVKHVEPVPATLLTGSPLGEPLERMIRMHLRMVVNTQKHGGWAYTVAWPSGMRFLSTKVVMPYSDRYFASSKDQISAYAAGLLLAAYEGLGDEPYLAAARRTADAYIALQHADGWWPYSAVYDPATDALVGTSEPTHIPLEDHAQAYPVLLLLLLHRLTGDETYLAAAEKGAAFITRAQNPNGSWSHHYNAKLGCGQNARSQYLRGGEINDDTTGDQMQVMLLTYRRTGDPAYLASFLRAADWLVAAFVDRGAKGWAQQYDESNVPVEARHFEPAAVSLSEGMRSPPAKLVLAWRLTGDERYLAPVRKWVAWMRANRTFLDEAKTTWGWYAYYDIESGRPIAMSRGEVRFLQPPKGAADRGYTAFLKAIEKEMAGEPGGREQRIAARRKRVEWLVGKEKEARAGGEPYRFPLERLFDWDAGSWLFWSRETPVGPGVVPQTVRVALAIDDLFSMRLAKGQVPWSHPYVGFRPVDWGSLFSRVVPPSEQRKPLTENELRAARDVASDR